MLGTHKQSSRLQCSCAHSNSVRTKVLMFQQERIPTAVRPLAAPIEFGYESHPAISHQRYPNGVQIQGLILYAYSDMG